MVCCITYSFFTLLIGGLMYLFNKWYRKPFILDFSNKYVFITGTDSGFGNKLAIDLDNLGVHVYAGCYTKQGAEILKKKTSNRLKTISLDVTNQSSVEKAKLFIENDLPIGEYLWGLVNNAGIFGNINFELSILEDYREVMEVNYFGSIRVIEVFEPLIKKSKGRIVQVASITGRGCMNNSAYTCTKWAIEPYADELRRYMRRFGVKVITIEPGVFRDTRFLDNSSWEPVLRRKFDALPIEKKEKLGKDMLEYEIKLYSVALDVYPTKNINKAEMVSEAMVHALGAKHPKTRYKVGYDTIPFLALNVLSTDWFLDGFIRFGNWYVSRKLQKINKLNVIMKNN